jgi:hypothetical protein
MNNGIKPQGKSALDRFKLYYEELPGSELLVSNTPTNQRRAANRPQSR